MSAVCFTPLLLPQFESYIDRDQRSIKIAKDLLRMLLECSTRVVGRNAECMLRMIPATTIASENAERREIEVR